MTRAARVLWTLVALALVPAAILAVQRAAVEGDSRRVAIVMDALALGDQAAALGLDPFELALRYQALGLSGIALYEETVETLAASGRAAVLEGSAALAQAAADGGPPPDATGDTTLVAELEPGALDGLRAKTRPPPREIAWRGRTWLVLPGSGELGLQRPAGADASEVERWEGAGFDLAWRPRNFPSMANVGDDFPAAATYLVHGGLEVAGWPESIDATIAASQPYLTAVIEGTEQDGMSALRGRVPTVRLLSFNQDYINLRLDPEDLIDKYLLAANERNVRLLYLRPYTEQQRGPMVENTEALVAGLTAALAADGFEVGPLPTADAAGARDLDYDPAPLLRAAAALGVLAGLGLLALLFPAPWGALAAFAVLGLGVVAGGPDWDALALAAALVFPVLGFGHLPRRPWALLAATGISLMGALLLVAVGSDRPALLALEPFAGVGATLVVPPALFLAAEMLRWRRPAAWLRTLWGHEVRLGEVAIALLGAAALALVVVRRGNFPVIGASEAELALRALLSEWFVRPRFKELLGHPLALLGLAAALWRWRAWLVAPLLAAGVVAQASILNSFSHYHTPLLVSLQRSVIALALGLLIGLPLLLLARLAARWGRRWLGLGLGPEPAAATETPPGATTGAPSGARTRSGGRSGST